MSANGSVPANRRSTARVKISRVLIQRWANFLKELQKENTRLRKRPGQADTQGGSPPKLTCPNRRGARQNQSCSPWRQDKISQREGGCQVLRQNRGTQRRRPRKLKTTAGRSGRCERKAMCSTGMVVSGPVRCSQARGRSVASRGTSSRFIGLESGVHAGTTKAA